MNPNYAATYFWYGWLLRESLGRAEEALALHLKGLELDPLSAALSDSVGIDLLVLGRFDEALARYQRTLEIDPGFALGYESVGVHYWLVSGQLDEAIVFVLKAISLDPGNPRFPAFLGMLFMDLGDPGKAGYWSKRSIEVGPEDIWSNFAMQCLHLYRSEEAAALDYGHQALANVPGHWYPLVLLRDHEFRAGRHLEARALYEQSYPGLLNEDDPKVDDMNYQPAIDLALVLSNTGEQERADLLLNRSLQRIQTLPRLGFGHRLADVQIYALQGDKQKALAALRQAIDEGWRFWWWYSLKHDPNLASLHAEPEFQAMVEEIKADMATQLERVREMERRGELAFPTELPGPRERVSGSPPAALR